MEIAHQVVWANQHLAGTLTLSDGSRILAGNSMTVGTGDGLTVGNFTVELSSMNLVEGGEGLAAIIMTGGTLNLLNGLTLDISGIANAADTMSFKIMDISGGTWKGFPLRKIFPWQTPPMTGMCWITTLPQES